jgi:hypothetical protein
VIIPKSVTPSRIEANLDLCAVELTDEDLAELDGLDEALVTGWSRDDTPVRRRVRPKERVGPTCPWCAAVRAPCDRPTPDRA